MINIPERYFRLGNGTIVMVLYNDPDFPIALSSDAEDALDTAFPFFPEDFNAVEIGSFDDVIARPECARLFLTIEPSNPLLLKPLSLVRMLVEA